MYTSLTLLALGATAYAAPYDAPFEALIKATSGDPCVPCQPKGATGTNPPAVGTGLSSLYLNVLSSVNGISFRKRNDEVLEARDSGFCCRQSLNCVNVQSLNIPMCYDKFTTNFGFADGSYGSLTTGDYSSGGATVNLFTGDYTSNGQSSNIYANNADEKPNTATLSIPPQFTGTGVGSAIPASQLGSIVVYTEKIPGTTITRATVLAASTVVKTTSGQTLTLTTIPAATITQPTTIAEQTALVTKTQSAVVSSSSRAAAPVVIDSTRSVGVSILGTVVCWFLAL